MIYKQTARFRKAFKKLPTPIKDKVRKAFILFKQNQQQPSFGMKKVQSVEGIWEGRVDISYRFTFQYAKDKITGETICLFTGLSLNGFRKGQRSEKRQ